MRGKEIILTVLIWIVICLAVYSFGYFLGFNTDKGQETEALNTPEEVAPGITQEKAVVTIERHEGGKVILIYDDQTKPMRYVLILEERKDG